MMTVKLNSAKRERGIMGIRTDLALELREMFADEISGVESSEKSGDGVKVTHIRVTTPEGAMRLGKPIGSYVTIEIDAMDFENDEAVKRGSDAVKNELEKLVNLKSDTSVLVVGLGNQHITPDSVGPRTAEKIFVTRHLQEIKNKEFDFEFRPVSAVAPGVLGITGIETGEIIFGIKERTKPDLIIAVDALASRSLSRLGCTVQLSDTGICPGSGVGNNRKELSEKSMGIPVIAIGIPMVVDAASVAEDTIEAVSRFAKNNGVENGAFEKLSGSDLSVIWKALSEEGSNMIVTPNNVDIIAQQASDIIAEGINKTLHGEIFD